MGQFAQLTEYKNNIGLKLITNGNLVKALVNTDNDFLNQSLPNNFNPLSLIKTQIYPYRFIPSITTKAKSFITMMFSNYHYVNNVFKSGNITFYIMCHTSLLDTDYGLRHDYMLDQIDTMFNQKNDVGSFNLLLDSGGDLPVNENYYGATISYKFTDFQI